MSLAMMLLSAAITAQSGGYSDVPRTHWASQAVGNLVAAGYLQKGGGKPFQGEQPVTRYEFAVMMDRFITDMSRAFLRKPAVKTINTRKIKGRAADGSLAAMIRLASEGYLPYYSPIFQGPKDTITPEQMAVAFAQVSQRLAYSFRTQDDGDAPVIGQPKKKKSGAGGGGN